MESYTTYKKKYRYYILLAALLHIYLFSCYGVLKFGGDVSPSIETLYFIVPCGVGTLYMALYMPRMRKFIRKMAEIRREELHLSGNEKPSVAVNLTAGISILSIIVSSCGILIVLSAFLKKAIIDHGEAVLPMSSFMFFYALFSVSFTIFQLLEPFLTKIKCKLGKTEAKA